MQTNTDIAEIGIIGGTGVYDPALLKDTTEVYPDTPYGKPSSKIVIGTLAGKRVAFLNRHGPGHAIPPHLVNSRANISALKSLGVKHILAPTAVGSLQESYKPGDLVVVDQFIDRTHGRQSTFYDNGKVCHISVADPFCPDLRKLLIETGKSHGFAIHEKGTMVCVNGPRFSTRAESFLFKSWGCHTINMTLVPECVLAREAEICYAAIAMVTDYDCWKDHNVSIEEIVATMKQNEAKVKKMLVEAIAKIPNTRGCSCATALKGALI
ncbi:MAG: S-methyl-5'-thioadenosine phosphorylase [Nanoarchaeota archaeon]|nr:S-methyl-5'-thioadenosine phosphorylase [Nanoarchaeota archaeon]MBU4300166.1 S-methyl-5'-thioadenosine phosphorylase [Nanoarchaeota archaeon]MBU4452202.1 S-methyl-5'-thioadenosine phosphorylase [Nanoarchaeota archaeon]MCG2724372.1 S-methyl-5'-thioadenosine phosphorylase [archaeon]